MMRSEQDNAIQSIKLPDNCMICDGSIQSGDEIGGTETVLGFVLPVCRHCTDGGAVRQVMKMDLENAA